MRTVRRLFYSDIVSAVAFVAVAFLSLFFFIDFVDELGNVGSRGYTMLNAAAFSLLLVPSHLYELVPIAVLIGAIYALARLAQTSQYTILRTGGLGPWRALSLLTVLGLLFAVLTYVVGDHVAPQSERLASELQALRRGAIKIGRSGAWLKDHAMTTQGERSYSVNVGSAEGGSVLHDVRVFEFDGEGRLLRRISAGSARVGKDSVWSLKDVRITRWMVGPPARGHPKKCSPNTPGRARCRRPSWPPRSCRPAPCRRSTCIATSAIFPTMSRLRRASRSSSGNGRSTRSPAS
jgi:lipopolysaccharide export system permease protein